MSDALCPVAPAGMSAEAIGEVPEYISSEFLEAVCVIPSRLYFATARAKLAKTTKRRFATLNTDDILVYEPFCRDFGPLNLGIVWRFLDEFNTIMAQSRSSAELVYYANAAGYGKVENAAFLLGCYLIDTLHWTAGQALRPFLALSKYRLVPFRDASYGPCTYELSLYACFAGFERARQLGWFSHKTFDLATYEKYEKVANGDLNWIVPNKFVAFSGPASPDEPEVEESYNQPPEKYVPIFKKWGVALVIRLNKKQYNARAFTAHNIRHEDLYFVDGSCPSESIVRRFLKICEDEPGAIAVHCKAGLGRTGTLIGCYAMRHYHFRAHEWIAWNRITRPGSVLGPQQQFLHLMEAASWLRAPLGAPPARPAAAAVVRLDFARPLRLPREALSPQDARVADEGDLGQGERLVSAKAAKKEQSPPPAAEGALSPRRRLHLSPRSQFVQRLTDFFSPRKAPGTLPEAANAAPNKTSQPG